MERRLMNDMNLREARLMNILKFRMDSRGRDAFSRKYKSTTHVAITTMQLSELSIELLYLVEKLFLLLHNNLGLQARVTRITLDIRPVNGKLLHNALSPYGSLPSSPSSAASFPST
ncbi:hypothetical protein SeLEV6574_g08194 [Synchytrium endobioticum]|uniref:Uncharacterized protein n=1 Tax=Synchytrium endobioticum TaxID=286115 RepID=A0A507C1I0_9FUNG|nr:hypothetical protein SeLEV6574_g08194 [Synchytrium endobioticum]